MSDRLTGRRVLILNSDLRPLTACGWQRGLVISMEGNAIVLELARDRNGDVIQVHSAGGKAVELPSVLMVMQYVKMVSDIRYSRYLVYARDSYTCQYCGSDEGELTIDHVRPKSDLRKSGDDEGALWFNRCC